MRARASLGRVARFSLATLAFALAAAAPLAPAHARAEDCVPGCRPGYTCDAGTCREACNPPCDVGFTCNPDLTCTAQPRPASGAGAAGQGTGPDVDVDAGWATAAGAVGSVAAALVGVALIAALVVDERGTDIGLGAAVVLLVGITSPIVAAGAASARGHPDVRGSVAMRVLGWVGYSVFMILGGSAVVFGAMGDNIPEEVAISLVLTGMAAELAFAVDAFSSASGASEVARRTAMDGPSLHLFAGASPEEGGGAALVGGVTGRW